MTASYSAARFGRLMRQRFRENRYIGTLTIALWTYVAAMFMVPGAVDYLLWAVGVALLGFVPWCVITSVQLHRELRKLERLVDEYYRMITDQ